MAVRNVQDAFLFDLAMAYSGEQITLEILRECADEVVDERARSLLTRHAEETQAQIRGLEQVFSMCGAEPAGMGCPVIEGVQQELEMFRQEDPAPEFLTATILFANLKIEHNEMATYDLLVQKAILMGQLEAAQVLTTICKQEQDTAGKLGRLIEELLLESIGAPGMIAELAAAGGGAVPSAMAGTGAGMPR